jgi:aryl-alcohol dehydrogenase-like predicted oxidoreductase
LGYGNPGDDESRFQVLDKLVEMGCTNWDTTDIYVSTTRSDTHIPKITDISGFQGDSEELIGKRFKRTGKRNQVRVAPVLSSSI